MEQKMGVSSAEERTYHIDMNRGLVLRLKTSKPEQIGLRLQHQRRVQPVVQMPENKVGEANIVKKVPGKQVIMPVGFQKPELGIIFPVMKLIIAINQIHEKGHFLIYIHIHITLYIISVLLHYPLYQNKEAVSSGHAFRNSG